LLQWRIVQLLGGSYLLWVALQYLWTKVKAGKAEHVALDEANTPVLAGARDRA
jgi:threonine/homoserine/homoserine lactone efflux protein